MSKPGAAPLSGPGRTHDRQKGATPQQVKKPTIANSNAFEALGLSHSVAQDDAHQFEAEQIVAAALAKHAMKENNPLAADAAGREQNEEGSDEDCPPPDIDHDEYANLFEEHGDEAEKKPNVIALKESGDNDLMGNLEEEVMVIAIPAKEQLSKGKGKGAPRVRQSDDHRRSDASKSAYKFALLSVVGMHCEEDVAYEHKEDLPPPSERRTTRCCRCALLHHQECQGEVYGCYQGQEDFTPREHRWLHMPLSGPMRRQLRSIRRI